MVILVVLSLLLLLLTLSLPELVSWPVFVSNSSSRGENPGFPRVKKCRKRVFLAICRQVLCKVAKVVIPGDSGCATSTNSETGVQTRLPRTSRTRLIIGVSARWLSKHLPFLLLLVLRARVVILEEQ